MAVWVGWGVWVCVCECVCVCVAVGVCVWLWMCGCVCVWVWLCVGVGVGGCACGCGDAWVDVGGWVLHKCFNKTCHFIDSPYTGAISAGILSLQGRTS
jgi:hypothetical protein